MTSAKGKDKQEKAGEIPVEEVVDEKEPVEEQTAEDLMIGRLEKEKNDLTDSYRRLAAEFDNFRKRTAKEKDDIYKNATANLVEAFLPVFDNMELAKASADSNAEKAALKKGIEMIYRQFRDVLDKLDVEEIDCLGEEFDPGLHHAIQHIEDDKFGDNEVVEVLMKGYQYKDKVIRHSMVKVAN